MSEEQKSELQKVEDLLEANGYHILKAKRKPPTDFSFCLAKTYGTILLEITPKSEKAIEA